jgi:hypothetical protein
VGGNEICQRNVDPSPEICDGLDNDCDGVIDDGANLCDSVFAHATAHCDQGTCVRDACDSGWADCSGNGDCETELGTNANCASCGDDCSPAGTCCGGACCNGCCSNSECKSGDTDAFCGSGGGVCDSCGNDESCLAGVCRPKCGTTGGVCRVFVTSTTQNGNLGGLTGADAICQGLADAAELPGIYKAWLSDDTNQPIDRFTLSTGPYHLVTGTKIADNWDDLTDGDIDNAINWDETGAPVSTDFPAFPNAWTNTSFQGAVDNPSAHCSNWSSDSGEHPDGGNSGNIDDTGPGWTTGAGNFGCNFELYLYCFQQS